MVLKFYTSSHVAGGGGVVALVLAEKQIPFEFICIDILSGGPKDPDFVAMNPWAQVPVIDDDGFVLYESRAICRYLAEKYADQGTLLLPTGLKEKALFEQAASIECANFYPQIVKVIGETLGKRHRGLPIDEAALASAVSELSAKLDIYEVILGKQKFLCGNELTLADLFHLCYAHLLAGVDVGPGENAAN